MAACCKNGIELRKLVLHNCKYFRPLVPPLVHGKKWEDGKCADMTKDIAYWAFEPDAAWHAFKGYGEGQYFIDPCKLQLVTPGIDIRTVNMKERVFRQTFWRIISVRMELFRKRPT